jgi:hypothetical protein
MGQWRESGGTAPVRQIPHSSRVELRLVLGPLRQRCTRNPVPRWRAFGYPAGQ